jgi:hypothetical protein
MIGMIPLSPKNTKVWAKAELDMITTLAGASADDVFLILART